MESRSDQWLEQLQQQLQDQPPRGRLQQTWQQLKRLGPTTLMKAAAVVGAGLIVVGGLLTWLSSGAGAAGPLIGTWEAQTGVGSEVFKFYRNGEFAYFLEGTGSAIGNQHLRGKYRVFSEDNRLLVRFETHRGVLGAAFDPQEQRGESGYSMQPIDAIRNEPIRAFYKRTLPLVRVPDWVCARERSEVTKLSFRPSPLVGSWLPKHARDRAPFQLLEDGRVVGWNPAQGPQELRYRIDYSQYPYEFDLTMPDGAIQRGIVDFPSRHFVRFNLEGDPRQPRPTKFDRFGYWKRAETPTFKEESEATFPDAWDLRNSSDADGNYYLVFVARSLTFKPPSPGHIYVAWVEESAAQRMTVVDAWGFYPRKEFEGPEALNLIFTVPGAVVNEDTGMILGATLPPKEFKGGLISPLAVDRFTVRVNQSQYEQSRKVIEVWQKNNYTFANRNCKNFVQEVALSLGVNVPAPVLSDPTSSIGVVETPFAYLQKIKAVIEIELQAKNR